MKFRPNSPVLRVRCVPNHPKEAHWASSERKFGCAGRKRGIKGKSQRQENSEHTIAIFKPSKESLAKNLISKVKPPTYGRFPPKTWLLGSTPREGAHVSWLVGVHGEIDKV